MDKLLIVEIKKDFLKIASEMGIKKGRFQVDLNVSVKNVNIKNLATNENLSS